LDLAAGLGDGQASEAWVYRLARTDVVSDTPLPALAAFRLACKAVGSQDARAPEGPLVSTGGLRVVEGWVAGAMRRVECAGAAGRYDINLAGIGRFTVDTAAGRIRCVEWSPGLSGRCLEEVLLGPPIALSLAGNDVWCLHASAVMVNGRAVLFLGHSGAGKSTLGAYCEARAGLPRLADDILPCSRVGDVFSAHPCFPQLKVSGAPPCPPAVPESVPISGLVLLAPLPRHDPVAIEAAGRASAIKALAEQTVAVGLFDRWLHARHLRFLSGLMSSAPTYVLRYPHDYGRLEEVTNAVIELAELA
jgi:hypothetical protein